MCSAIRSEPFKSFLPQYVFPSLQGINDAIGLVMDSQVDTSILTTGQDEENVHMFEALKNQQRDCTNETSNVMLNDSLNNATPDDTSDNIHEELFGKMDDEISTDEASDEKDTETVNATSNQISSHTCTYVEDTEDNCKNLEVHYIIKTIDECSEDECSLRSDDAESRLVRQNASEAFNKDEGTASDDESSIKHCSDKDEDNIERVPYVISSSLDVDDVSVELVKEDGNETDSLTDVVGSDVPTLCGDVNDEHSRDKDAVNPNLDSAAGFVGLSENSIEIVQELYAGIEESDMGAVFEPVRGEIGITRQEVGDEVAPTAGAANVNDPAKGDGSIFESSVRDPVGVIKLAVKTAMSHNTCEPSQAASEPQKSPNTVVILGHKVELRQPKSASAKRVNSIRKSLIK